jgi:hypothetical protein
MSNKTKDALLHIGGTICRENARSMDSVVGGILQLIAAGEADHLVTKAVSMSKPIDLTGIAPNALPTEEAGG